MDSKHAWQALETWLSVPGISLLDEPPGIDTLLANWAAKLELRFGHWTDAYLQHSRWQVAAD